MRRSLFALVSVVLVASAACSAGDASEPAGEVARPGTRSDEGDDRPSVRPRLEDDDDDVLVLGDSLVNGARLFGDLGDRLDAAGFDSLAIVAEDGRDPAWGIEQVERMREVPEVVVVQLGTNPDADPEGFAEVAVGLVQALRDRGAERIAWLTPVHGRDDRYAEKSAILTATPGIDRVADWASEVHDDPRRLAADGIHPTQEGYGDLAEFLVATAASLAR